MTFPYPTFMPDAAAPKAFTYLGTSTTSTGTTTRTIAGVSFGDADPSRIIIVTLCMTRGTSITVNSATIGGVAATIVEQVTKGGNSVNPTCCIIVAEVPTGTTGDIVIVVNASPSTLRTSYYRAVNLVSNTAYSFLEDASGADALSINVPDQGLVVGVSCQVSTASSTWTNLTERTEGSANSTLHSFADSNDLFLSASTPLAISATGNTGNGNSIVACWY